MIRGRQKIRKPQPAGISDYGLIWICYILHTLSVALGGITSLVAIVINYIKKDDQDQLMRSHMAWQIKTFWLAIIFFVILFLLNFILHFIIIGVVLAYPLWLAYIVWYCCRQIKGMLALNNRRII